MRRGVQAICLRGQPVAMVAGGEARVVQSLSREDERTVQAMCLFAMEVQTGAVDAPYSDARALTYARLADRQRSRGAE